MDEKITIIEGPTPTFEAIPDLWVHGLTEGMTQTDMVVTLCATCALSMDGTKEHPLAVGEYTMLFCADECKRAFSKDIAQSVLAMKPPASEKPESP